MVVNRYKLTSNITGEVIIGTSRELEAKGFDGNAVVNALHQHYLVYNEWNCEYYDRVNTKDKSDNKVIPKKKLSIDDVQRLASEAGMNYGEYVATHNL